MLLELILTRLIRRGALDVRFPDGEMRHYAGSQAGPKAAMEITTTRALRRLVMNPGLAFGEAYMAGEVRPLAGTSIYDLLNVLILNLEEDGAGHPAERLMEFWRVCKRRLDQLNLASRARRNAAHHYDLDRKLFSLFLDPDLQYSCAYFPSGNETLEEAQQLKMRHIIGKLHLDRPNLEVLEIGCGWGGMALTTAREWGARVTGLTLSTEQLAEARWRAEQEGLADRVRFELCDYRQWTRPVDRVLSVAMFEAVGVTHFRDFFTVVRRSLNEDGVAVVHSIGRANGPAATNPWITKYIFPGSYCPALSEVLPVVERAGLWTTDIEIWRGHYARTLALWRDRFAASRAAAAALYDERFCRMFEFYLASCELAFRHVGHMNWQLQLTRNQHALPASRDYMLARPHSNAARANVHQTS